MSADPKNIDLHELFLNLQKQMSGMLSTQRNVIKHPGTKGDTSELSWIKMLKDYLPKRYDVKKAFVLDSKGNLSDQLDVVIFDNQYSPFLFNQNDAYYVPAESVYAVFEVKQEATKPLLVYAGQKIESVRKLYRTSAVIPHAGGKFEPKKPFNILGGFLCLESTWNPPLGNGFESTLKGFSLDQNLDLGCFLNHGSFETHYTDGNLIIEKSKGDNSLIFFFLNLLRRLQLLATVPAIDLNEYMKSI